MEDLRIWEVRRLYPEYFRGFSLFISNLTSEKTTALGDKVRGIREEIPLMSAIWVG